jgi:antitoxin ChpS
MHRIKLRKVGGSVMFPIPKSLLEALGLTALSSLDVSVSDGALVATPQTRPKFSLADLIAQCDGEAKRSAEDAAWLNDGPAGNEVI